MKRSNLNNVEVFELLESSNNSNDPAGNSIIKILASDFHGINDYVDEDSLHEK